MTEGAFNTLFLFTAAASFGLVYVVFKVFFGRDLWEEEREVFSRVNTLRDVLSLLFYRKPKNQTSYWPIICFLVFFVVIFYGLGFVLAKLGFLMPS